MLTSNALVWFTYPYSLLVFNVGWYYISLLLNIFMHLFNFRFFSRLFCFIHLQILFASFPVVSGLFMFCPREYPAGHLAINWKKTSLAIVSCHSSPYDRQRQSKVDFDVNQTWFRSSTHCHERPLFWSFITFEKHFINFPR